MSRLQLCESMASVMNVDASSSVLRRASRTGSLLRRVPRAASSRGQRRPFRSEDQQQQRADGEALEEAEPPPEGRARKLLRVAGGQQQ